MKEAMAGFVKFIGSVPWTQGLMGLHYFNWFLVFFLVLGLFYGMKKGMLRIGVEIIEFALVIFFVMGNYVWLCHELMGYCSRLSEKLAMPFAFFLIFSIVWAAVMVVDQTMQKWVQAKTATLLRVGVGAIFGVFYFFLIFSMVCTGLSLLPSKKIHSLFQIGNNRFGAMVATATPEMYDLMSKKFTAMVAPK
jgi:uncharacterized membrane protein